MGLIKQVYDRIGEITARREDGHLDYWLQRAAWFASRSEDNSQGNEHYWDAAKAFFTLHFLVARKSPGDFPIQQLTSRLTPQEFKAKYSTSKWDAPDIEILTLGLRYADACSIDFPVNPGWWTSRRELVGLEDPSRVRI